MLTFNPTLFNTCKLHMAICHDLQACILDNKLKIFWTNLKLHGTFVLRVSSPFSVSSGDFSEFSAWSCGVVMSATICSATWNHVKRKATVAQANRGPFVWRWKLEYMGNNTLCWQFYHRWSRHWGMQQSEFNIFSNNDRVGRSDALFTSFMEVRCLLSNKF